MSEIMRDLLKIPSEITYFANDKMRVADGETFVITEDHSITDILRFCVEQLGGDLEEVKRTLDHLDLLNIPIKR